jgi:putative hydrolase of the HAD superfamily
VPLAAVIFDWGGTLSEYANLDIVDMWRLAAHHLAPEREEELLARLVAAEDASWQRVQQDQRSTRLGELLETASADLGMDVTAAVLEEAATHHLDSWTPHIRHDPEAAGTLAALKERGLRTGLLSNTHWPRSFHERFLARDGLAGLIDARCYTSELEFVKPHPAAFAAVLDAVGGVPPEAAVFVGDRPYDDVAGAKAVGMRTVLRPNPAVPGYDVEPDAVITRLPDLLPLVDAWSR